MVVGEGENGSPFLDQIALRVIWAVLGQASGVGMTLFYGVGVGKVQGSQEVRGSEGEMARVGRNRRTRNWSFQFAIKFPVRTKSFQFAGESTIYQVLTDLYPFV